MNDNTILRIKVPANLYESVKKQLTLNEAKKAGHNYGAGMEVVKEKKMKAPKDGMQKVEEEKVEEMKDDKNKVRSLEELMKAKEKLESKINEMEMASKDKVNEAGAGVEYAWIPGAIAAGLIAANVVKAVRAHMKEKNLSGLKGFWQAYQEVGKDASSTIDKSMSGGMEEAKKEKEEDK
jgi:Flp pilus assembly pilin Flp